MADDKQLVAAVLAQQPGAFAELVGRYQNLVWHVVYRMVPNAESTRDLSQETFLRVHRQLRQFRFGSALGTWIGSIAFSVAARYLRRRSLELDDEADLDSVVLESDGREFDLAAAYADAELLKHMHASIAALPALQRLAITLRYLEEKSVAEIAQIMDMPEGTIKSHLFRARSRLRSQLESLQECRNE